MLLAGRPIDKSAWPQIQALPATLPAPAAIRESKYPLYVRFTAGSYAPSTFGHSGRVVPGVADFDKLVRSYVGSDAGAALAAAAKLAAAPQPYPGTSAGSDFTGVGLYQAKGGAFLLAPLWISPGTNDKVTYYPLDDFTRAASPDARFRFTDDRLAAVVTSDGWIANPAFAAAFAGLK